MKNISHKRGVGQFGEGEEYKAWAYFDATHLVVQEAACGLPGKHLRGPDAAAGGRGRAPQESPIHCGSFAVEKLA